MPCYGPGPTEDEIRKEYYKEFEHNSPLAEILCSIMKQADSYIRTKSIRIPQTAWTWYTAHKKRDAKRVTTEQQKARKARVVLKALKKLTKAELKALKEAGYS